MLALVALTVMTTCPIEGAQYSLRGSKGVAAYFLPIAASEDWPSGLALVVRVRGTSEVTWWLPWQGGTDGSTNIASTTDVAKADWLPPNPDDGPRPFGDRSLLTFDRAYNINGSVPRRGDRAPAHMLAPEAGSSSDRVFPARQFFDLIGCRAQPN